MTSGCRLRGREHSISGAGAAAAERCRVSEPAMNAPGQLALAAADLLICFIAAAEGSSHLQASLLHFYISFDITGSPPTTSSTNITQILIGTKNFTVKPFTSMIEIPFPRSFYFFYFIISLLYQKQPFEQDHPGFLFLQMSLNAPSSTH